MIVYDIWGAVKVPLPPTNKLSPAQMKNKKNPSIFKNKISTLQESQSILQESKAHFAKREREEGAGGGRGICAAYRPTDFSDSHANNACLTGQSPPVGTRAGGIGISSFY